MNENLISEFLACIAGLLMGFLLGTIIWGATIKNYKKEAVERNFAEYVVDSSGHTTFTWKEDLSSKEE